jgi:hypothetical protein
MTSSGLKLSVLSLVINILFLHGMLFRSTATIHLHSSYSSYRNGNVGAEFSRNIIWSQPSQSFPSFDYTTLVTDDLIEFRQSIRVFGAYLLADEIKLYLATERSILLEDFKNGTTSWRFEDRSSSNRGITAFGIPISIQTVKKDDDIFVLAKKCFELSERQEANSTERIEGIVSHVVKILLSGNHNLHGRHFADLAFSFALTGTKNESLFNTLALLFQKYIVEVQQKNNDSLNVRWVRHAFEKFAGM